jgi:hypothetical protein
VRRLVEQRGAEGHCGRADEPPREIEQARIAGKPLDDR